MFYHYDDDNAGADDVLNCRFTGSEVRIQDDEMPHAHVAVAVEGAGWPNPDNIPLMITNTLIGTWDRSVGSGSGMAGQLAMECSRGNLCNSFQVIIWSLVKCYCCQHLRVV